MNQPASNIPQHVAIIPDGNRRWAKQNDKAIHEGHQGGFETLMKTADLAFERGIKYVTGYIFSTENWNRAQEEVGSLMKFAAVVLEEQSQRFHEKGTRIRIIGSRDRIDPGLAKGLDELEELTKDNQNGTISICFNYGGRADIVSAVNRMIQSGISTVDQDSLPNWLSTHGLPDPELVIRTSGERRLSNFLIWESAYSELYFCEKLWPDFGEADLDEALSEYAQRKRNFGK